MNHKRFLRCLVVGLCLECAIALPAFAQIMGNPSENPPEKLIYNQNFDPPGEGKPEDTDSSGSRPLLKACQEDEPSLVVLAPPQNYGLTLAERPSLFVYVPETTAEVITLKFRDPDNPDETQEEVVSFAIGDHTGLTRLMLPSDRTPLKVGVNYRWYLSLECQNSEDSNIAASADNSINTVISGWVQRAEMTPEIEQQLANKTPIEQAQWYGANGYWYELIDRSIEAQRLDPDNEAFMALWKDFISSFEHLQNPSNLLSEATE